jgi:SAM-dependent methyltransferase
MDTGHLPSTRMTGRWDTPGCNLAAATTAVAADSLNARFYGRIQYPGPPVVFERVVERGFWSRMLAQDIGYWGESIVTDRSEIWVAGCGANQALITALRFPEAQVLGSDLSEQSLDICRRNSTALGLGNLELRHESINDRVYVNRFDYVVCTGVIHHNADPKATLRGLAKALTPHGVLELMVYNQYHRICSSAVQLAVRTMTGTLASPDLEQEASVAKQLAETFDTGGPIAMFLSRFRDQPFVYFADTLLQPIEHSFTVASLRDMAADCGLELLGCVVDHFSRARGAIDWNMSFRDPELRNRYENLSDTDRWQITNYLLLEDSPMLWFYLQKMDSPRIRRGERAMSQDVLARRCRRNRTHKEMFGQLDDGSYSTVPTRIPFPPALPSNPVAYRLYQSLDESVPLSQTFAKLGLDVSFKTVHPLRIQLATSAYPFLSVA